MKKTAMAAVVGVVLALGTIVLGGTANAGPPVFPKPGQVCRRDPGIPDYVNQGGCVSTFADGTDVAVHAHWCRIGFRVDPPWSGPFVNRGDCVSFTAHL